MPLVHRLPDDWVKSFCWKRVAQPVVVQVVVDSQRLGKVENEPRRLTVRGVLSKLEKYRTFAAVKLRQLAIAQKELLPSPVLALAPSTPARSLVFPLSSKKRSPQLDQI